MGNRIFKGVAITLGIIVGLIVIRGLIIETSFEYDNLAKDEHASQRLKNLDSQMDQEMTIFSSLEAHCQAMFVQETTQEQRDAATRASNELDGYFKYVRAADNFHQVEKEYPPRWFLRLIPSFRRRYESVQSALDANLPVLKRKLADSRAVRAHYNGACRTGNLHDRPIGEPSLM
jgi:hypothetical protein